MMTEFVDLPERQGADEVLPPPYTDVSERAPFPAYSEEDDA
jgi:hypothetical protein